MVTYSRQICLFNKAVNELFSLCIYQISTIAKHLILITLQVTLQ